MWRPIAEADMTDDRPRVLYLPALVAAWRVVIGYPFGDSQWVDDCGEFVEPSHFIPIPEAPA